MEKESESQFLTWYRYRNQNVGIVTTLVLGGEWKAKLVLTFFRLSWFHLFSSQLLWVIYKLNEQDNGWVQSEVVAFFLKQTWYIPISEKSANKKSCNSNLACLGCSSPWWVQAYTIILLFRQTLFLSSSVIPFPAEAKTLGWYSKNKPQSTSKTLIKWWYEWIGKSGNKGIDLIRTEPLWVLS